MGFKWGKKVRPAQKEGGNNWGRHSFRKNVSENRVSHLHGSGREIETNRPDPRQLKPTWRGEGVVPEN